MTLSIFMPSVTGMEVQGRAMGTVSMNIANMRTVGYKKQETMFYTLLGTRPVASGDRVGISSSRADVMGVGAYDRTSVIRQGEVAVTGNSYDVAINGMGNAFFLVKDPQSGQNYYTRAGDFTTRTQGGLPYLITKNGLNVQGYQATGKGTFAGGLSDIRIDYPEKVPSTPTTKLGLTANVPADTGIDATSYGILVYGPNHDGKSAVLTLTRVDGKVNTWEARITAEDGTVSMSPTEIVFDGNGNVSSPTPKTLGFGISWSDGSANPSVQLDISTMTQLAGASSIQTLTNDGRPSGNFLGGYIDTDGIVKARYSNGDVVDYAKIALVGFVAPENLVNVSGTMFAYDLAAGNEFEISGPNDTSARRLLVSQAVENSTSNVEEDFANMILIQRAYALNGKSFTAANEMMQTAVNLKA